jgi:hypothetical protein
MPNYVNKNQLGISSYANTEQLIVKVAFVLASPHCLRMLVIYFSSSGKYKKELLRIHLKQDICMTSVEILQAFRRAH